ncbi:non-ribosomal peptide synthetase [Rhodopseudomonas palustris]|uniref:Amino acid adenylation n=1 Tax=Rhodopseudomonas palustris (strain BisB18) TaxID=316056 RepID=Q212V9_RHOPB
MPQVNVASSLNEVERRLLQQVASTLLPEGGGCTFRVLEIAAPSLDVFDCLETIATDVDVKHLVTHASVLHLANLRLRAPNCARLRFAAYDPTSCAPPDKGPFDLIFAARDAILPSRARQELAALLTPTGRFVTWQTAAAQERSVIAEADGVRLVEVAPFVEKGVTPPEPTAGVDGGEASPKFPLTDIQHAYWVGRGDVLDLGGVACHVYFEWEIPNLDAAKLERAWNDLIQRHGMLRAVVTPDGEQCILPDVPHYTIAIEDVCGLPAAVAESRRLEKRARMSAQVLDAHQWPLFEICVTRLSAQTSLLHLDLDLLIVDVQSFHILLSELEMLYRDSASLLPAPSLTYRDYLLAIVRDRESPDFQNDRAWWFGRIADLPGPPRLPAANRGTVTATTFRRLRRRLPTEQWQTLERRARAHGITCSSLLLAAFSEVLARWVSEPRFLLNLTQFDRRPLHPDVMRLVGDFTSVLLIDIDAAGRVGFVERARVVQATLWRALAHARFSGIEALREIAHRRGERADRLMPIVFTSLLGIDIDSLVHRNGGGGMLGEPCHLYTCTPQVSLDHQAMIRNGSLEYNWIVIDDVFPPGVADALFEVYGAFLDHLASENADWTEPSPDVLLSGVEVEERARANGTAVPMRLARLERLFLEQASRSPDAIAVIAPDAEMTYGALRERMERFAGALTAMGGGPGEPIGVALPKGADQIAAVLAILHVGAFYVPISHDMPNERIGLVVAGAGMNKSFGNPDARRWPNTLHVIDPKRAAAADRVAPRCEASLDDPAYVIYTSGSTGVPKGVTVTHRAAANTIVDVNNRIGASAGDRVFGISALGFDLSVYDIFGTLVAGAALVLPAEEDRREPDAWLGRLVDTGVTIWNSVPALMQMLVEHVEAKRSLLPQLRWTLLSGDWVPLGLPDRIRAVAPGSRMAALGGATEAAIWSNWYEIGELSRDWPSIPYGFPLANQRYHILDDELRPRPNWVEGDLFIAGDGLASGYYGDPKQTARAFFEHPRTGERLYRTGDRARYRPGGIIEFLGRRDHQVKINGMRIELGEVEACLVSHPDIEAAVVEAVDIGRARKLVSYVVPSAAPRECFTQRSVDAADAVEHWDVATTAMAEAAGEQVESTVLASLRDFERIGEELSNAAIRRALVAIGLGDRTSLDPKRIADDVPHYAGLVRQWLDALTQEGTYRREGDRFVRSGLLGDPDELDRRIERRIAELRTRLSWTRQGGALVDWISTCVRRLPDIVRRQPAEALELLFPDGDFSRSEALYQDNVIASCLGRAVAEGVAARAAACRGRLLRIMEIGAGVGGLTSYVLPRLAGVDCEYVYTDVSPGFLKMAKEKFGAYGFVRYDLYDIQRAPEEQVEALHGFDIVLAANVLHNGRDVVRTLSDVKRLLCPGGMLAVIEATRNKTLQLVTGGLIEGLHAEFDDDRRDSGLPMLNAESWCRALREAGYPDVAVPAEGQSIAAFGQQVIVARGPETIVTVETARIDAYLRGKLPAYMVPSRHVRIDRLPLSLNGKIDRSRLPRPVVPEAWPGQLTSEPPREGIEAAIAGVWRELLGCKEVSRTDSFFNLGGDSLIATRLASRLRKELGRDVALRLLFDHPVLADQAVAISEQGMYRRSAPVLLTSGPKGPLVCLHASDGYAAAYRPLAERLQGVCVLSAVDAPGLLADERPLESLSALAAYHRGALGQMPGSGWQLLGWSMGAHTAWKLAGDLIAAGERVMRLVLIDPSPRGPFEAAIRSPGALLESCASDVLRSELLAQGLTTEALDGMPDADRVAVWRRVLSGRGLPDSLLSDDDALGRMIAVMAANLAAMVQARLAPLPPGPEVVVYTATRRMPNWGEPLMDWSTLFPRSTHHVAIDADHWSILASDVLTKDLAGRVT